MNECGSTGAIDSFRVRVFAGELIGFWVIEERFGQN